MPVRKMCSAHYNLYLKVFILSKFIYHRIQYIVFRTYACYRQHLFPHSKIPFSLLYTPSFSQNRPAWFDFLSERSLKDPLAVFYMPDIPVSKLIHGCPELFFAYVVKFQKIPVILGREFILFSVYQINRFLALHYAVPYLITALVRRSPESE